MKALMKLAAFIAASLPSLTVLADEMSEVEEVSAGKEMWARVGNAFPPWGHGRDEFYILWVLCLALVHMGWKYFPEKAQKLRSVASVLLGCGAACGLVVLFTAFNIKGGESGIVAALAAITLGLMFQQGVFKGFPKSMFTSTKGETSEPSASEPSDTPSKPPGPTVNATKARCSKCDKETEGKKFCKLCGTPRDPSTTPPDNGSGGSPTPAPVPPSSIGDLF